MTDITEETIDRLSDQSEELSKRIFDDLKTQASTLYPGDTDMQNKIIGGTVGDLVAATVRNAPHEATEFAHFVRGQLTVGLLGAIIDRSAGATLTPEG